MGKYNPDRAAVRIQDDVVIPADAFEPDGFGRWVRSPEFPESGRIDFLDGTIEVEMSPERLKSHGSLKTALVRSISNIVEGADIGQVFIDRTRLVSADGRLSCEPDIVFVSLEALISGRITLSEPSRDDPEDFLELVGAATLVVEIVSKSSVSKDTRRLPPLYAATGVEELWTVDGRGDSVQLQIQHLLDGIYRIASLDAAGFQESRSLNRWFRIRREPSRVPGIFRYLVDERP